MEQNVTQPVPTLKTIERLDARGFVTIYVPARRDLGERFTQVLNWSHAYRHASLLTHSCEILKRALATGAIESQVGVSFIPFLEGVLKSKSSAKRYIPLVRALAKLIAESMDECSQSRDWKKWGEFVKRFHVELDLDRKQMLDRARAFCECEVESILEDDGSADDIESYTFQLKQVVEVWGLDISDEMETLEEREEELRDEQRYETDEEADHFDGERKSGATDVTDCDIDRLFGSLQSLD